MVANYGRGQRVGKLQAFQLQQERFLDVAGGYPGWVHLLHHPDQALGCRRIAAGRLGDLLVAHLEKAVAVEVADDEGADLLLCLGEVGEVQLPVEVGVQVGLRGEDVEAGWLVPVIFFAARGIAAFILVAVVFPVYFLEGGLAGFDLHLGGPLRCPEVGRELLGRRAVDGGLARLLAFGRLFEHGVDLDFLLDGLDQFEPGELQQLDRLLELGSHHQLLAQFQLLPQFKRHRPLVPLAISHYFWRCCLEFRWVGEFSSPEQSIIHGGKVFASKIRG